MLGRLKREKIDRRDDEIWKIKLEEDLTVRQIAEKLSLEKGITLSPSQVSRVIRKRKKENGYVHQ